MRSVVIHLVDTTHEAVSARLSRFVGHSDPVEWRYPRHKPALYIEFYNTFENEFEPGELLPLESALGRMPDVTVIAQVSGRVPGDVELRELAECLLGTFRGLAKDEFSDHYWTIEEIRAKASFGGLSFFDYARWHRDRQP
jgi:hypothetical protein